ncbi:MAG: acetyl-CoA carboxylase biotin carboxyl carrier protein [Planctomycetota bacterium]|jgi:acetyl-CoA carboxylase biotin carboxyl carrier protein
MADNAGASGESFNLDKLKELIELMEKHGLSEVHLRHGSEQWRLRRGGQETVQLVPAAAPAPVAAAPAPLTPAPAAPAPAAPAAPESDLPAIKSPIVGTFYSSPSPDDPAFVQKGSKVSPDSVVCIVEAMKVFNQITADVSGTIEEILVNNGDPVESGQPLFRVRPN